MKAILATDELLQGILKGNKTMLSKAITLVESKNTTHRIQASELIDKLLPYTGKSIRIGFSGVPGVGKSTLMESLGLLAISQGKKLAVLAIDPSSQYNKGSILGDKTRMEELAKHANAFIRPSPSSGFLGGVALATYETILLCEAFGYDTIFIETVGVGQNETQVADLTDAFVLLTVSNTGDELQGIKRGIMELADILFINKVDKENENSRKTIDAKTDLVRASQLLPKKYCFWQLPILTGSALNNHNVDILWNAIHNFLIQKKENHFFEQERSFQRSKRFYSLLHHLTFEKIKNELENSSLQKSILKSVETEEISTLTACLQILNHVKL